jgi:hypothetical protein
MAWAAPIFSLASPSWRPELRMPITRAEYVECKSSSVAYPQRRRQISEFTQVSCTVNITSFLSALVPHKQQELEISL